MYVCMYVCMYLPSRLDDVDDISIGDNDVLRGFFRKRNGDIAGTKENDISRKLLLLAMLNNSNR